MSIDPTSDRMCGTGPSQVGGMYSGAAPIDSSGFHFSSTGMRTERPLIRIAEHVEHQ
jgi:hypothetical protein